MRARFTDRVRQRLVKFAAIAIVLWFALASDSQTISTGALTGVTLDLSGAVIPGVAIQITGDDKADTRSTVTDDQGRFAFLLLAPGVYQLRAAKSNFETSQLSNLPISVTETLQVQIFLKVGMRFETMDVLSGPAMVRTSNSGIARHRRHREDNIHPATVAQRTKSWANRNRQNAESEWSSDRVILAPLLLSRCGERT